MTSAARVGAPPAGDGTCVVIPVHQRRDLTLRCLEALMAQTVAPRAIVVVDDGSTDGTAEVVAGRWPAVTILRGDGSMWWTGAVNAGVQWVLENDTDCAFVLLLNNDVTVDSDYVARLQALGHAHWPALLGSVAVGEAPPHVVRDGGVRINWRTAKSTRPNEGVSLGACGVAGDGVVPVSVLSGRGVLIPLAAFRACGLFAPEMPQYGADYEFSVRASNRGFRLLVSYSTPVFMPADESGLNPRFRRLGPREVVRSFGSRRSPNGLYYRWAFARRVRPSLPEAAWFYTLDVGRSMISAARTLVDSQSGVEHHMHPRSAPRRRLTAIPGARSVDNATSPGRVEDVDILGVPFGHTDPHAIYDVIRTCRADRRGRYICEVCASSIIEASRSPGLHRALCGAYMNLPDGMPVAWAISLLSGVHQQRLSGPSVMLNVIGYCADRGYRVGLYGSTPDILSLLVEKLKREYPGLALAAVISPPFDEGNAARELDSLATLRRSRCDVLFVALGAPKQEQWMLRHSSDFGCLMIGVGAAFEYNAGLIRRAPRWMQALGLEWLARLIQQPRRVGMRFATTLPVFAWRLVVQLAATRLRACGRCRPPGHS